MADFINDPNKGVPIATLLKKHGGFTAVVEKTDWFDPESKPRKKKSDVTFDPAEADKTVKDQNGDV